MKRRYLYISPFHNQNFLINSKPKLVFMPYLAYFITNTALFDLKFINTLIEKSFYSMKHFSSFFVNQWWRERSILWMMATT